MVENKDLREQQENGGSDPNGVYDYHYFSVKFGITKQEVIDAIEEAQTSSPVELEDFIAKKYNLSEDNPDGSLL